MRAEPDTVIRSPFFQPLQCFPAAALPDGLMPRTLRAHPGIRTPYVPADHTGPHQGADTHGTVVPAIMCAETGPALTAAVRLAAQSTKEHDGIAQ
jgi:hypothetical protein